MKNNARILDPNTLGIDLDAIATAFDLSAPIGVKAKVAEELGVNNVVVGMYLSGKRTRHSERGISIVNETARQVTRLKVEEQKAALDNLIK